MIMITPDVTVHGVVSWASSESVSTRRRSEKTLGKHRMSSLFDGSGVERNAERNLTNTLYAVNVLLLRTTRKFDHTAELEGQLERQMQA